MPHAERQGPPENAPVAGQPYAYIVQQLHDFKNGLRASADPRKPNTAQMIEAAKDMTDDGDQGGGGVLLVDDSGRRGSASSRPATVPKTRLTGNVFFPIPDGGTEPIGKRIIEAPEDAERFELRDPRSGFVAYVPPGSLKKGAALVASGGGKTTPCGVCHGPDLKGLGPVPGHRRAFAELHGAAALGHAAGHAQGHVVAADEAGRRQPDAGRHAGDRRLRRVAPVARR